MEARTAIAAADGISTSSENAATALHTEREQADEPASYFTVSDGVFVLTQPAGTSYAAINGHARSRHEVNGSGLQHVAASSSEGCPPGMGASSNGSSNGSRNGSHAPQVPNSKTPLGLGSMTFTIPIQSWGGDDEPHAAQSAAARASVAAGSAARTAAQAPAHTADGTTCAVCGAAAAVQGAAGRPGAGGSDAASSSMFPSYLEPLGELPAATAEETPKPKGGGSLGTRVLFGALLGIGGAAAVAIKPLFLFVACFITYHATQEYYAMVTSKGITRGMAPPPRIISGLTTVICVSMVLFSYFYTGRSGTVLAVAAFFLLVMNMVAIRKPKFSMLASTLFGVFYCGWLPNFWVKLRFMTAQAPALAMLPNLGPFVPAAAWTVGLVATFTTVICVVAADTGAYFVGKTLGRTKLTDISPKKTVEGAVGGLASSVAAAVALWKVTQWPPTPLAAAGLGVLAFFSSLFGDLIESIIKRDAGMKDSGDLIPGHGGLLDRFDSYMFTGAVAYFYVVFILPYIPL